MSSKCCLSVPLRYGLLVWSYLILIPNTMLILQDYSEARYVCIDKYRVKIIYPIFFTLGMILRFTDYLLTVLLIVVAHMKIIKLLRFYLKACLVSACLNLSWVIIANGYFIIASDSHGHWIYQYCAQLLLGIIYVVMQLYIITLVRSQVKLKGSESFEFSNIAEAQADCEVDAVRIEGEREIVNGEENTMEIQTPEEEEDTVEIKTPEEDDTMEIKTPEEDDTMEIKTPEEEDTMEIKKLEEEDTMEIKRLEEGSTNN